MNGVFVVVTLLMLGACVPVSVNTLPSSAFAELGIPRRVMFVGLDRSADTAGKIEQLAGAFADAGFAVVAGDEVDKTLAARGLNLAELLNTEKFGKIGEAGVQGVVLVREFYGTEVRVIDTGTGALIASGCWRTSYITVANSVIEQLRTKKMSPLQCPVKIE